MALSTLRCALALAALAAALAPGCSPGGHRPGEGRGVLVVCIDGLREDHLGGGGYDRDTSPVLDELAREGVRFTQAWSTSPLLLPAHASLLTGCDPYVSRRILPAEVPPSTPLRWNLPDEAPRLAREFLRQGWATAAFADDPLLAPVYGFEAGFQVFQACEGTAQRADLGIDAVSARFLQWLSGRGSDANWFAYLHLHDLERAWQQRDPLWDTYFHPRPALSRVPPVGDAEHLFFAVPRRNWPGGLQTLGEYEAQYDGAIRRLDKGLGRLFTHLRQAGRLERTTVAVVGSHGIGFGESGLLLDHGTLSDADLHVPLILRPPADMHFERGLRTSAVASLLDVAPTLLDLAGLAIPREMQGVSLAPLILAGAPPPRTYAFARGGLQEGFAVMDERWCYELTLPWAVDDPDLALSWYGGPPPDDRPLREVLHDRRSSPGAGHLDQGPLEPEVAGRLRGAGTQWLRRVESLRRRLQTETWGSGPEEEQPLAEVLGLQ